MSGLETDKVPRWLADAVFGEDSQMSEDMSFQDEVRAWVTEVVGMDPESVYPVPMPVKDFEPAEDLRRLADDIIQQHKSRFSFHLQGAKIRYAWRQKGGKSAGKAVLGKCVKLSGHAQYFAKGADYLIWLAADHCRALEFTRHQVEALLYHELCHVEKKVTEEGEITFAVRGHDVEMFRSEIEEYGLWKDDLELAARSFQQVGLPGL